MARKDDLGLVRYLDNVEKNVRESAMEAYKEQIDIEATNFYKRVSDSRSQSLNLKIKSLSECKVDTTSNTNGFMVYGYKIDWSKEFVNPDANKPITWHDLAYILNYGNKINVLGDSFINNAQRRLKGLDQRAYRRYLDKVNKKEKEANR